MLSLDPLRIALSFAILIALAALAARAVRSLRVIFPFLGALDSGYVPVQLTYHLTLCIGSLAVLLLILPAAYGFLALGLILVALILGVRIYRTVHRVPASSFGHRFEVRKIVASWRAMPVSFVLTTASIAYFGWSLAVMRWPPPGDIMSLHGPATNYLATGGYSGVAEGLGYYYPVGFHATAASFVGPLGLYPAEGVFVFGGFVAALVPPMLYVLARQLGAPRLLALLAFSAAFVIHPSDHLEKWILGAFFNGPYPNLLGYLIVLLLVIVQVDRFRNGLSAANLRSYSFPALVLAGVLILVYPNFAILVILHLVLLWATQTLRSRGQGQDSRERIGATRRVVILVAVVIATVTAVLFLGPSVVGVWELYATPPSDVVAYRLDATFFVDNLTGVLVLLGVPLALRYVAGGRLAGLGSFYLLIAAFLAISIHPDAYSIVWPILPSRSVIILGIIAWPLVLASVRPGLTQLVSSLARLKRFSRLRRPVLIVRTSSAIVFVCLFAAQGITSFPVSPIELPTYYGWFSHSTYFMDDLGAIEWLAEHASPSALVLSDGSYASRFLLSIGFVRLTHGPPLERNRTFIEALNQVWNDPGGEQYMTQVLKTYDIQYVLSTSEWGTLDRQSIVQYVPKPFGPEVYAETFDRYVFLQAEYRAGTTRIYRVIQSALPVA